MCDGICAVPRVAAELWGAATPLYHSEVHPAAVAVMTKQYPRARHLGDLAKISDATLCEVVREAQGGTAFYITASKQLPYHINPIMMIEFSLKYHFES